MFFGTFFLKNNLVKHKYLLERGESWRPFCLKVSFEMNRTFAQVVVSDYGAERAVRLCSDRSKSDLQDRLVFAGGQICASRHQRPICTGYCGNSKGVSNYVC